MMKGVITACIAIIVLFGFVASPAIAKTFIYPNERPLNDPMINALVVDAHKFHNQRITGTHCSPENSILTVADDIREIGTMRRAEAIAVTVKDPRYPCTIMFNGLTLRQHQTEMQVKQRRAWTSFDRVNHLPRPRWHAARLCRVVYHEVGHNEGLEHSDTGLMQSGSSVIPDECINWARKMVPRPVFS